VSDQETAFPSPPAEAPIDPLFTHPASPFERTNPPAPVAFASPAALPGGQTLITPMATWTAYKTQIQFGFAGLAYLMFLVGAVTVVAANPSAGWRYWVAALPLVPTAVVVFLVVRQLGRLDEVQKRMHMQAIGFSLAATGLVTFGYGFLEGAGLPDMSPAYVLPLMAFFWALGVFALALRMRLRR
jgi:hypothetical protein